jgi:hypothetical protein
MIRGTNAEFKFKLPYPKSELAWVTIKFWQPNNEHSHLPITKKLVHCQSPDDSTELCVSLTADETMRFSEKYKAKVQLRAQHSDGTVFGSRPQLVAVYPMNDEILEEDPIMSSENKEGWIILDGETIATS